MARTTAVTLLLVGACWQDRASTAEPTRRTVAPTRAETHDERLASISIPQIESDLRMGGLAAYLNGPLVALDLDTGQLRVLCGDGARQLVEQISASFTDAGRVRPHCRDTGPPGYELSCGQMVFRSGRGMRNHELREVDLVIERDGAIRLESAWFTLQGNEPTLAYHVQDFNQAKKHARCPP